MASVVSTETPETFTVLRLRSPRRPPRGTPRKPRNPLSVAYGKDTETHGKRKKSDRFFASRFTNSRDFSKRPSFCNLPGPPDFPCLDAERLVRLPCGFRGLSVACIHRLCRESFPYSTERFSVSRESPSKPPEFFPVARLRSLHVPRHGASRKRKNTFPRPTVNLRKPTENTSRKRNSLTLLPSRVILTVYVNSQESPR